MSKRGFTMVEVIISSTIFLFISVAVFSYFITSQRSYMRESKEIAVQRKANIMLEKMTRGVAGMNGIMSANSITISNAGKQITYTVPSGITQSFWLWDQDGNANTIIDNVLRYDPNTSVNNDEYNLTDGVLSLSFTNTNNVVTVSITLRDTDRGTNVDATATTDVLLRNV